MATTIKNAIDQATTWLLNNQDQGGGWAERAGREVSTLNTAEAIIAILEGGGVAPGDKRVQAGVKFLINHQCRQGPEAGAWMREFHDAQGQYHQIADMVRTSFALLALIKAGVGVEEEPVEIGVNWLLALSQEADGCTGWGFRRGAAITLMPTCFSLLALMEAYKAKLSKCREAIDGGLNYLVERCRNNSGSFGEAGRLEAVHTIYAALVLQMARQCELSPYVQKEEQAIEWLLNHPNDAGKLVEERILLVPEGQEGDYGFLFMTDALLIKVIMDSKFRDSKLAREALISLRFKRDEGGSFYGYRVFSWSTAKAISALSAAATHFENFPEATPEYVGAKTGNLILIFAIFLAGAVVYLTKIGDFTWIHASIFMVLMLSTLVAYRIIGEMTFKEILINLLKKKS